MQSPGLHDDEKRRASSYHSYSQSPPYDYQYEDRRYGKQAAALTRKPGSDKGHKERRSCDERDTSSEKGGQRSSSATDDSQDASFQGPERVKIRQYGKSCKEVTALYKSQEIQAHNGRTWSMGICWMLQPVK